MNFVRKVILCGGIKKKVRAQTPLPLQFTSHSSTHSSITSASTNTMAEPETHEISPVASDTGEDELLKYEEDLRRRVDFLEISIQDQFRRAHRFGLRNRNEAKLIILKRKKLEAKMSNAKAALVQIEIRRGENMKASEILKIVRHGSRSSPLSDTRAGPVLFPEIQSSPNAISGSDNSSSTFVDQAETESASFEESLVMTL